jgi:hypothetical protein
MCLIIWKQDECLLYEYIKHCRVKQFYYIYIYIWVFVFSVKHNKHQILTHILLCITEFVGRTASLHISAHGAIIRRYINKPYTIELYLIYGSIYCVHRRVLRVKWKIWRASLNFTYDLYMHRSNGSLLNLTGLKCIKQAFKFYKYLMILKNISKS